MADRADQHRRDRTNRDRSMTLLLAGMALLMPPLAQIFHLEDKIGGIPATLIYVFVVWALLILGAQRLARPLRESDRDGDDDP